MIGSRRDDGPWPRGRARGSPRRGISYLEVVVASVVYGLSLTGIAATMVAQERLMQALEQRVHVMVPPGRLALVELIEGASGPPSYGLTAGDALYVTTGGTTLSRVPTWLRNLTRVSGQTVPPSFTETPATLITLDGRRKHFDPSSGLLAPPRFSATHGSALSASTEAAVMTVEPSNLTDQTLTISATLSE